ncbi:unnamed protein product [Caretta caretta]
MQEEHCLKTGDGKQAQVLLFHGMDNHHDNGGVHKERRAEMQKKRMEDQEAMTVLSTQPVLPPSKEVEMAGHTTEQ